MNAEKNRIHERLLAEHLPPGWTCEKAWPWQDGTHLIAPYRAGGVVVKDRHVHVQLPKDHDGPCSPRVDIGHFVGRRWLDRMVEAAVQVSFAYAPMFIEPQKTASSRRAHQ